MFNNKLIVFLFALTVNNFAVAALNDTGITTCSNATQNGLPCPVAGFPGQDAEYGTNSFNFTKLDANGNAMSVAATNHSCVQDNVTGLMWEVKTDDGGLRDKDNTYTFDQAATFATQVNATNLCGYNDWRVPNPHELASIVDYSVAYPGPTIDEDFFPYTSNSYFWTNTPYAAHSSHLWIVDFSDSYVGSDDRGGYGGFVRCVRLGQWLLPLVFTDQGNGTVTEASTGLMWAKCSVGQGVTDCSGSPSSLTWQQALQAADNSTLAGYTDWRLPNIKELQTLVDYTKYSPSINPSVFPNTPSAWYYSSSPSTYSSYSWVVYFDYGFVSDYVRGYYGSFVRCVRNVSTPAVTKPTVVTNAPSVITATSARLGGTVTPNGAAATTSFNFGPTTTYGQNLAATPATIAATAAATTVIANKTGLTAGTTYHYRVTAANSKGTSYGTDKTFTTTALPPPGQVGINSGVTIAPTAVTVGQNFTVSFNLKEFQGRNKTLEYVELWIQNNSGNDLYMDKHWDNQIFLPNQIQNYSITTNLDPAHVRVAGTYKAVVRGKAAGAGPFNFGIVSGSGAINPKTFTAAIGSNLSVLTVQVTGAGTVTAPNGFFCIGGNNCIKTYAKNSTVKLTATPAVGARFKDWTGTCLNSAYPPTNTCNLTLSSNKAVQALFEPITSINYVALGDSYSSGEGAPSDYGYIQGTNTETNKCHRSELAYSQLSSVPKIADMGVNRSFFACSGAETQNVTGPNTQAAPDNIPQINHPELGSADMVSITVGGNDIYFATFLKLCAEFIECENALLDGRAIGQDVNELLINLRSKLETTYAAIKSRNGSKPIFVLGYPDNVISDDSVFSLYFSDDEVEFLGRIGRALNNNLKCAAAIKGVHFVPVADKFKGHESYTGNNRWINNYQSGEKEVESFHPNSRGHIEYANILQKFIQNKGNGSIPINPSPNLNDPACNNATLYSTSSLHSAPKTETTPLEINDLTVEPTLPLSCGNSGNFAPNQSLRLQGTGFKASSAVALTLRAQGGNVVVTLGTVTATAQGVLNTTRTLPATTPTTGLGLIQATGTNASGASRLLIATIGLAPSTSADGDSDGFPNICDNCPTVANAGQVDSDGDGLGNACDTCTADQDNDFDHDGLCGDADLCPFDATNDVDGDGICAESDNCSVIYNPEQSTCPVDLIITNTLLTPASPVANGTFTAKVTVKNQGTLAGDGKFLDVWNHRPTSQSCGAVGNKRLAVGMLAAGASKTLTVTGVPAGIAGSKMLRAFVDSGCSTAETNEGNNQFTAIYPVNQATGVDFVVTAVALSPTAPTANGTFTAKVTVKNQGTVAGDGKFLDVWSHQPTGQVCGAVGNKRLAVGVLAAGASKTLTITGLPSGIAGSKMLRAFVDIGCGTAENNEGNNQLTKAYSVQ